MAKYYYNKSRKINIPIGKRLFAVILIVIGVFGTSYAFLPILSWQIYFAPAFASQDIASPIPKTTIVQSSTIQTLLSNTQSMLRGVDYSNAQNWFPTAQANGGDNATVEFYTLSIPTLGIKNATVSTKDYDLSQHLVNYPGTGIPGQNGTAVVFGHSTLPQLFDPKNYKTIFATAYKLQIGDEIQTTIGAATYIHKIFSITVVDPTDASIFTQVYDNSYITIVTCTPPGTTWKRLIIRARLEKI